jgi:hypothetical protein
MVNYNSDNIAVKLHLLEDTSDNQMYFLSGVFGYSVGFKNETGFCILKGTKKFEQVLLLYREFLKARSLRVSAALLRWKDQAVHRFHWSAESPQLLRDET